MLSSFNRKGLEGMGMGENEGVVVSPLEISGSKGVSVGWVALMFEIECSIIRVSVGRQFRQQLQSFLLSSFNKALHCSLSHVPDT